jgi:hypothetical protein
MVPATSLQQIFVCAVDLSSVGELLRSNEPRSYCLYTRMRCDPKSKRDFRKLRGDRGEDEVLAVFTIPNAYLICHNQPREMVSREGRCPNDE